MSSPRQGKHDWYKSLRGADLTPAEGWVLVLLAGYSGADRENAYPGVERLAKDAGMTGRGVQKILDRLEAKRAITMTQEGGNQVFKGAANVYRILTPPQRPKGEPPFTLQDDTKGDTTVTLRGETNGEINEINGETNGVKGEPGSTKGEQPGPGRVNPRSPHQVNHQVIDQVNARARVRETSQSAGAHERRLDGKDEPAVDLDVTGDRAELRAGSCRHPLLMPLERQRGICGPCYLEQLMRKDAVS